MSPLTTLSASQLRQAAAIKEKIVALEAELDRLLGGSAKPAAKAAGSRTMSNAGRARIAAAARARWAKFRAKKASAKPVKKPEKVMSAAARKKLAAIAKARWAKVKAAGKKAL